MPGNRDIIMIACEEKDVVCSLERAYQAVAAEDPDKEGTMHYKKKDTSVTFWAEQFFFLSYI